MTTVSAIVEQTPPESVAVVSSFRVHFGDCRHHQTGRRSTRGHFADCPARLTVFRPGILLGKSSRAEREFRQLAPLYPSGATQIAQHNSGRQMFCFKRSRQS